MRWTFIVCDNEQAEPKRRDNFGSASARGFQSYAGVQELPAARPSRVPYYRGSKGPLLPEVPGRHLMNADLRGLNADRRRNSSDANMRIHTNYTNELQFVLLVN